MLLTRILLLDRRWSALSTLGPREGVRMVAYSLSLDLVVKASLVGHHKAKDLILNLRNLLTRNSLGLTRKNLVYSWCKAGNQLN